jgi:hypothetical protein
MYQAVKLLLCGRCNSNASASSTAAMQIDTVALSVRLAG